MSTLFCTKGPVSRALAFSLAVLCIAAVSLAARAQVAPTLLPYTLSVIAGGATTSPAAGASCPVSGFKSTDAFGDGCLATEVALGAPRYVTTDSNGVVYFADTGNGLIRRIDPLTGVISIYAGGAASSPASGATCGSGTSTDSDGNGCPATLVKLGKPMGVAFSPAGDLYFADNSFDGVRKIDHTTGIITNIIGNTTYGYNVNNTSLSGPVNAATHGYLNFPYGIAFDAAGNLYIADEGNQDLSVVNLGTASVTLQGMAIPAGTVAKFAGYGSASGNATNPKSTTVDCPDFVSTSNRGGCYFGAWTDGALANVSGLDNPLDIALDPSGNIYFANFFNYNDGKVTPANVISNFAGIQGTSGTAVKRATAGSFGIGHTFNVATDASGDVYVNDGGSGVVYRIDPGSLAMYPVAGGAASVCANATDAAGDGCPATQAILGKYTGTTSATYLPGGAGGLNVDPFGDLLITDTTTNVVRRAASGTYFGAVGANQPTQTVAVHFAASDAPASNPFSLTSGSANFSLGAFSCAAANTDGTTDCTIAVTATPSTLGPFSGTLTVKSSKGATSNFTLSGNYITSPLTRTVVSYNTGSACNPTTVPTTAPITLTAAVVSTGSPTGTLTFFANGTQIGTPQTVGANGTATLVNTFSTPNTYVITAKYSGDTNFNASTSGGTTIASSAPTFATALLPTMQSTVVAGQTGLYSFTVAQNIYTGTISFACTGLPAYSSCVFSPATLTATGCTITSTVALSILTQQATSINPSALGVSGNGRWTAFGILPGILLALFVGIRRRKSPLRYGQVWLALAILMTASGLMACGKTGNITAATPSGTYTVTVQATGSAGTITSFTVPLTVK
ncbi:MAG TPA: Ig-like domain repeat protein [Acidobacteriaceae bacterium]|nr:Ig-like domain repeat protein [Acidobacteriaceae bacterium]